MPWYINKGVVHNPKNGVLCAGTTQKGGGGVLVTGTTIRGGGS